MRCMSVAPRAGGPVICERPYNLYHLVADMLWKPCATICLRVYHGSLAFPDCIYQRSASLWDLSVCLQLTLPVLGNRRCPRPSLMIGLLRH